MEYISAIDAIWDKFALYLMQIVLKNGVRTAPSNDIIWTKFSGQHQHQSTKKAPYSKPNLHFFGAKRCKYNAHFRWVITT